MRALKVVEVFSIRTPVFTQELNPYYVMPKALQISAQTETKEESTEKKPSEEEKKPSEEEEEKDEVKPERNGRQFGWLYSTNELFLPYGYIDKAKNFSNIEFLLDTKFDKLEVRLF